MRINNIIILFLLLFGVIGCQKENTGVLLPDESVVFAQFGDKDTVEMPLSILKDSLFVLSLQAALVGETALTDHWVTFAVDTTKMTAYRDRFGDARILPTSTYLFYKKDVRISAGTAVSDEAELNIGQQTKLEEYTTYVLPIVIQSVDGQLEYAATNRVVYFVFKTGQPLFISKTGWTIENYSSYYNAFVPTNVLDNDDVNTYWTSNITQQMPQWVTINFNRDITFNAVNYYVPRLLNYPTQGGYPTIIRIETSMDGTNWEDNGTFAGDIADDMQTLPLEQTTARYLRFTCLETVKYASTYDCIFISGISLVP